MILIFYLTKTLLDKNDKVLLHLLGIALTVLLVSLLFIAFANLYFIYGKTKGLAISCY